MSPIDQLSTRPLETLTDAELDALSAELEPRTGCGIAREGFNDHSLTYFRWVWTGDGYVPDPAGKTDHWPLAESTTALAAFELALHLRRLRP